MKKVGDAGVMELERRSTKQRRAILGALQETRGHPSAKDILGSVRRTMPRISAGTVYRNLKVLRDDGLIRELQCGTGSACYDGFLEPHYHFVCRSCGGIFDLEMPVRTALERAASRESGHAIVAHSAEFYGRCRGCGCRERSGDDQSQDLYL